MMNLLIVAVLLACVSSAPLAEKKKKVCYYTNWPQYRPNPHKFFPEQIDPFLCDYVMYAFAYIDEDGHLGPYEYNDEEMFARLMTLKQQNPALKCLLAVGGWYHPIDLWTQMLNTTETRGDFIDSAVSMLRQHEFDGLDVDFEYPGSRGSPPEDKYKFTALLRELRAAFDEEGQRTGRTPLMVTAAVGCGKETIDAGYEIDIIHQYVDWLAPMGYDFHTYMDNQTGIHSALYVNRDDVSEEEKQLCISWCAQYWETGNTPAGGAPKDKLVIGLPTYGRGFTLEDPNQHDVYDLTSGPADPGTYTREGGMLASYEVCESFLKQGALSVYDEAFESPYAVLGDQWVGYENLRSAEVKATWVRDHGYAGAMVWCYDLDDHMREDGSTDFDCQLGVYPLISTIMDIIDTPPQTSTSTSSTTSRTTSTTTTSTKPYEDPDCTDGNNDFHEHTDCTKYWRCTNYYLTVNNCPPGLYWHQQITCCDWCHKLPTERQEECACVAQLGQTIQQGAMDAWCDL